jgi:nitroreductase
MRKILPVLSFSCLAVLFIAGVFAQDTEKNDTLKTIHDRKSVREFKDSVVSQEQLMILIKAGMAAPTAVDRRPWDFVVITDREILKQLSDALPHAKMAVKAGAAIVVTGDLKRQFGGEGAMFWIMDCSAASENILLAAESMGLGAVWTAVFPDKERISSVRKILGIPDHVMPLNLIPVGVPASETKAKDKFNPGQIHKNHW